MKSKSAKNKTKKMQKSKVSKPQITVNKKKSPKKAVVKSKPEVNKKRILTYIIPIATLFLLVGLFLCLDAKSVNQKEGSTFISSIDDKELEAKKADLAKEDLLKNANYLVEDFNLKIKDTNFEKLSFEKNVPILMYHYIEPESAGQSSLRRGLGVTPENFEAQVKWLYDNGFKTLTLSNYFSLIAEQKEIPPKTVLITIDDGYRDFFDNGAPILNRYNMTATIFIITDSVGYPAYMDWDQIELLSDQGFEFGSHTLNHPNLKTLKDEKLKDEVVESRARIEKELGKVANFFCYPTGAFDQRVEDAVRLAGYRGSVTTGSGYKVSNKNMFELPRLRVTHTISLDGFAWMIDNAQ